VNNLLFTLIVLVNGYIMVAPLWPAASFWWRSHHTAQRAALTGQLQTPATSPSPARTQPNSLIIPAMLLNSPTLEGPRSNWSHLLRAGIWRWPSSSTPDKGGNTVFLAHRFSYTGPRGAFYYLDKLQPGDEIGVVWNHKTYTYTVTDSRTVSPTDTSIENNTPDSRLTLFTCAPLWHPVNRLVVTAKLKDISS
jgi:LPXTG-site transpeptidase (sortase) family protein